MLSANPSSLCCTILICLPLSLFFVTTTTNPISTFINTANKNPLWFFVSNKNTSTTTNIKIITSPPPPPPPPPPVDDDELFRLAAQVNPNSTPTDAPKKIAFMFMTTTPLPFAPLWELYFSHKLNLFNIYIHADPSFPYNSSFTGVFSGRVIPSKPTQRGSPSLISAARRLLAHALLHDPSNAMFALFSPSCVPLHSFNFTYNTLVRSNKSFIEILKNEPRIHNRYAARGADTMLPEVPFESFRVGSQFFILTRRHAKLVMKDERLWAKFKLPCVSPKTCYPEEHYFSTLLSMEDSRSCVPATLTHVDWTRSVGGHPYMYKASEVGPKLIISLRHRRLRYGNGGAQNSSEVDRNHSFLFARKFSPGCLEPLMGLANDVIFQD